MVAGGSSKTLGFLRLSEALLEPIRYFLRHGCDQMRPEAGLEFSVCSHGSAVLLAIIDSRARVGVCATDDAGLPRAAAPSGAL